MASTWISVLAACALAVGLAGPAVAGEPGEPAGKKAEAGAASSEVGLALFAPPEPSLAGVAFEQSAGGAALSAMAFATSDPDWARKWMESGQPLPKLRQARLVALGDKVQVLVFVASRPGALTIDASKEPMLYVVDVYRPDGGLQERMAGNTCMKKGEMMEGGNLAVCEGVLVFELEPSDPKGQWVFKVSLAAPGQDPLVFGTSFEAF